MAAGYAYTKWFDRIVTGEEIMIKWGMTASCGHPAWQNPFPDVSVPHPHISKWRCKQPKEGQVDKYYISFARFFIGPGSVRPADKMMTAIHDFPELGLEPRKAVQGAMFLNMADIVDGI